MHSELKARFLRRVREINNLRIKRLEEKPHLARPLDHPSGDDIVVGDFNVHSESWFSTNDDDRGLDPFSTCKNGARYSLWSSIDSSFHAESIDTHNDHDIKIFGYYLASFPPRASKCAKFT